MGKDWRQSRAFAGGTRDNLQTSERHNVTNNEPVGARRIPCLEQMTESSKREVVSCGLAKIAENIRSLFAELTRIENTAARAWTILTHIAAEEAGKGFLLVDYMRPYHGVSPQKRAQHLRNVYSHLARGIYVKYYETRPDSFGEVESIVNDYRVSHYLDGPSDVDWIFRNEIEEERERELYVDLVSDEEGLKWYSPTDLWKGAGIMLGSSAFESPICNLFLLMYETGLFSEEALNVMAETWKDISISSTTHWVDYLPVNQAFMTGCGTRALLSSEATSEALTRIADEFLYPLCALDLRENQVSAGELRERRERHLHFVNREYY